MTDHILERIKDARTHLVFEYLAAVMPRTAADEHGTAPCHGDFHIHANRRSMAGYLQGRPQVDAPRGGTR
jgi:hypothetical protein